MEFRRARAVPKSSRTAVVTMTHVLHRQIGQSYPVASSGHGTASRDATGKEYIDASGGAAVSCLGHSHPDVLRAMREQLDRLAYAHTSFFTTEAAEELADEQIAHAPEGMGHVLLVSGGSPGGPAAPQPAPPNFFWGRPAPPPDHLNQ